MRLAGLALIAACGDNRLVTPIDSPAADVAMPDAVADAPARVTENLIAMWAFDDGAGATIADSTGTLDLLIADPSQVTWMPGALAVDGGTAILNGPLPPAPEIKNPLDLAIRASGAYTVEVWVQSADVGQDGTSLGLPAWVITFANRANARNVGIGQHGASWFATSRNQPATDPQGLPGFAGGTVTLEPTHLVVTGSDTGRRFFVDGALVGEDSLGGPLDEWNIHYRTNLAGEPQGTDRWRGTYFLVAVYDRALPDEEISQNFAAGF